MSRQPLPSIGKHLAVLNLFREADGSVQATCASATGARAEWERTVEPLDMRPFDYVERLIVEAAANIVARRPDLIAKEPA